MNQAMSIQFLLEEIDNFDGSGSVTDSINWNLKWNDRYWHRPLGQDCCHNYTDAIIDLNIDNVNTYHAKKKNKEAHERKLAEVRLQKRQRLSQTLR